MKRRFLFLPCSLLTAGLIACTVSSNVGDLPRTAAESGIPEGGNGDVPEGSLLDAPLDPDSPLPPVDAGCGVTFAQEATAIDIQVRNGTEPPPTGGTLATGTYVLTGLDVYYAGTTGTARVRETMEVRGSSSAGTLYRLVEVTSASGTFANVPLHGETTLFEAEITAAFFTTPQCPQKSFQITGDYSVTGDTLVIYESAKGFLRTYRRIR